MKRPLALHISAILIGLTVALGAFYWLQNADFRSSTRLVAIGEISSIEGRLDRRSAGTVKPEITSAPSTLHHQDLLITQSASSAILKFTSTDTVLRLNEGTRFVAELDPNKKDAIIATLIDGTATIVEPGKPGLFKAFKGGQELALSGAANEVIGTKASPLITPDSSTVGNESASTEEFKLVVTATKSNERPKAANAAASSSDEEKSSNILTNEDIIRRLRGQSGFFQRCYLGHIHREQTKSQNSAADPAARTVVVAFTIQSSGRVNESHIVRSDFKDSILHSCVTEVLERTAFRGFKGEPVPVREFPISFQ